METYISMGNCLILVTTLFLFTPAIASETDATKILEQLEKVQKPVAGCVPEPKKSLPLELRYACTDLAQLTCKPGGPKVRLS